MAFGSVWLQVCNFDPKYGTLFFEPVSFTEASFIFLSGQMFERKLRRGQTEQAEDGDGENMSMGEAGNGELTSYISLY